MNCRFSVSKTYSLPFLECEPLKANYDASHSKSGFTAQSKVLSEAVLNFLSNQGSVQQSRLWSQFVFQCCDLKQLLNHFISICISIFKLRFKWRMAVFLI